MNVLDLDEFGDSVHERGPLTITISYYHLYGESAVYYGYLSNDFDQA